MLPTPTFNGTDTIPAVDISTMETRPRGMLYIASNTVASLLERSNIFWARRRWRDVPHGQKSFSWPAIAKKRCYPLSAKSDVPDICHVGSKITPTQGHANHSTQAVYSIHARSILTRATKGGIDGQIVLKGLMMVKPTPVGWGRCRGRKSHSPAHRIDKESAAMRGDTMT